MFSSNFVLITDFFYPKICMLKNIYLDTIVYIFLKINVHYYDYDYALFSDFKNINKFYCPKKYNILQSSI